MSETGNTGTHKTNYLRHESASPFMLDYKKILLDVLKFWWLFAITVPLALFIVYMMHRYTQPIYRTSMTLLMEERGSEKPQNSMMEGFGLSSGMRSLDNQIAIMRSWEIIRQTVRELDFHLSYYKTGRMKSTELYGNTPFIVQFDSLHPQLINTPIYITRLNDNQFKLNIDTEQSSTYIYGNSTSGSGFGKVQHQQTYSFGSWIQTPWLKIKIDNRDLVRNEEKGHYFEFNNPESLTGSYQGAFQANKTGENTSIVRLAVTGNNTQKNIVFLNTLAKVFIRANLEKKNQIATNTIGFIEEQLLIISDSLINKGSELSNFRTSHQIQSVSTQATILFTRIEGITTQISELRLSRNYYVYLRDYFSSDSLFQKSIAPAAFPITNTIVSEQIKKLIELNNERQMLSQNRNPYFIELDSKMEVARQTLLNGISSQIQIIDSEIVRLRELHAETASQLYQLPETERKMLGIERQFDLSNEVYTFLLRKRSEAQIQKASNTPDHTVLESARYAGQVYPTTQSDKKQAVLLGLLLPMVFIVLRQLLNNKINGSEDVERITRLPVIGHVIHNNKDGNNVVTLYPKSVIAETFRRIRTRLEYMTADTTSPIIAISSSMAGEGKTFCALNLASVFAISGKKTVLVGFDMRKPGLNKVIDLNNHQGLSQYLIGKATFEEIVQPGPQDDLYLIASGAIPPNPSELIGSQRAQDLFQRLRKEFDIILLDTPPMGIVTDGYLLARHADSLVFLTRQDYTVKEVFIHTIRQMNDEGIKNIGILINDINVKKGILGYGYGYSYGYGYGYGYGKGYGHGYYEE